MWILCVKWKMEGIDVNLDTTIGKWFSKFSSTITGLAETQYANDDTNNDQSRETVLRKLKNELIYYKYDRESLMSSNLKSSILCHFIEILTVLKQIIFN